MCLSTQVSQVLWRCILSIRTVIWGDIQLWKGCANYWHYSIAQIGNSLEYNISV